MAQGAERTAHSLIYFPAFINILPFCIASLSLYPKGDNKKQYEEL